MKNKNNTLIISIGSTGLVRAGRSIQITNKILGEICASDNEWWKSLSPEWKKVIYANYIIQREYKQECIPYSYNLFKGDRKEEINVLRKYEVLYNVKLVKIDKISQKELNDILEIESLDCCNTIFNDYTPLNKLANLKQLFLNGSSITNFENIQKTLMGLKRLEFNCTTISNILALEKSTNLERLSFSDTNVNNISALKNLINLEFLICRHNKIKDISVLENLINLRSLDCSDTEIDEIKSLSNLHIQKLRISETKVKDLTPLILIKDSLFMLSINSCEIGDESANVLCKLNLGFLDISWTKITKLSFIKNYNRLEELIIRFTSIKDISPSYNMKKLIRFRCIYDRHSSLSQFSDFYIPKSQLIELSKLNPACKMY